MANCEDLQETGERKCEHHTDDGKAIISNVFKICQEEKAAGKLCVPLTSAVERPALYTGVSESTVYRIQRQKPLTKRKTRSDKVTLDDFDVCVVHRTIHDLLVNQKRLPTINILRTCLQDSIAYKGGREHLRQTLHGLGFSWKKTQSNRTILMERVDIVNARVEFLRKIRKLRDDGRTIVYTDETFINSSHTVHRSWQSREVSLKAPFSKGERLIIVHAGSKYGFINGAGLIFKAHSASGDYHDEMNGHNFVKWLKEKLIPNLPPKSVLVVDNAPYHNLQLDKCPTQTTRKADIQIWLRKHDIPYDAGMLKPQLIHLCKINKPAVNYILDSCLREYGHECLRLPAYHADLNAIELVWAQVKGYVGRHNKTFKMSSVVQHTEDAIDSVTAADWNSCCEHVHKVEQNYTVMDVAVDDAMDRVIIEVVSSDEATDTASDYDSEETETASGGVSGSETDTADECAL